MRVKNYTDETLQPTEQFVITDTEGNEYFPVPLPDTNPFAYNPGPLPAPSGLADAGLRGGQRTDPGRADPLQAQDRIAAEPSARAAHRAAGQDEAEIDLDL